MPGYDWPLLADHGGESIESLIATFLRRLYANARQTNPSQGDGGIDIILETDEGVIVWQIKKYTSPVTSGQWTNIKRSWSRFEREHVGNDKPPIRRYHLVTPWTPTDEKLEDFRELTNGAGFSAQWDGEAFINGLADQFPDTMDRFLNGPNNFERFVSQRALIAGSPIERADEMTMLRAVELRQNALDDFRATMSDNWRIEHGTRTVRAGEEPPMPPADDAAVFHRFTYLGENRWSTDSVVPTSAESMAMDPINVEVTFLAPPGTSEYDAVRDWREWGIPFQDVPARTLQTGGPFSGETHEDSLLSFVAVSTRSYPSLFLKVTKEDGTLRFHKSMRTVEVTHGSSTGWLRLVIESTHKTLRMDFRSKSEGTPEVGFEVGDVEGLVPADVLREVDDFQSIGQSDTFVIEIEGGAVLLSGTGMVAATVIEDFYRPVAASLTSLQSSTVDSLLMPRVLDIQMGQFETLKRYVSVYGGEARVWTWEESTAQVPEDPAQAENFKIQLRRLIEGEVVSTKIERPLLKLADSEYRIQRPIVTTQHSLRVLPELDIDSLLPGQTVQVFPGEDNRVTIAAVVDWSPDNDVNM
tara:strand:+ start:19159 stop:20907 length:1749 start_codon:yes stop_codon:yes gene_type:complete